MSWNRLTLDFNVSGFYMFMKLLFLAAFAVLIFVGGASNALGCTCSAAPTVLEEFAATPIVVTARLDSFEELDRVVAGTNVYRTMAAIMTVEKSYKGPIKPGQTMRILDGGGGDCSRGFVRESVGQSFLFYTVPASRRGNLPGKLFWISSCTRTARIEDASPDLTYLEDRLKLTGKTRLSGTIKRFGPEPPSLANIKVTVTGNGFDRSVETDERGFFELWDLPAGQYAVAFEVPRATGIRAFKISPERAWRNEATQDKMIRVTVGAKKHVELTIGLDRSANGR